MTDCIEEIRARVELMADPKQEKWDLSPNDQAALRGLLTELSALREEVERLKADAERDDIETLDSVCRFLGKDANGDDIILTWREVLAGYDRAAALSPSPAQQEGK